MLILNRKAGQSIIITAGDSEIIVTVDKISGGQARLSIQAPLSVIVDREEIHRKKKEQG